MSTLPALGLSAFAHPDVDGEWRYGPDRGLWTGGYPITATREAGPGEPTLEITGPLSLVRDEIPNLIAWLTAVHEATEPADPAAAEADDLAVETLRERYSGCGAGPCGCGANPSAPVEVDEPHSSFSARRWV